MPTQGIDVDSVGIVNRPGAIAHGDDAHAALVQLLTDHRADVAETLHHSGTLAWVRVQLAQGLQHAVHHAASRRLAPADAAAQLDRLAGDDLGTGVADVHAVRVHDPGHRLLV